MYFITVLFGKLPRYNIPCAHRDDQPFVDFIAERVLESEKEIMRLLHIPIPKGE